MQLIKLKKSNPSKGKEKPIRTEENTTICWFNEPNQLQRNTSTGAIHRPETVEARNTAPYRVCKWQEARLQMLCDSLSKASACSAEVTRKKKFWLTWQLPRACYDDERNLWLMKSCLPVFQKGSLYWSIKIKQVVSGTIPIVILRLAPNSRNFYRKHETQFSVQLAAFALVPPSLYQVNKRREQFIGSQRDFFFSVFLPLCGCFVHLLSTFFLPVWGWNPLRCIYSELQLTSKKKKKLI